MSMSFFPENLKLMSSVGADERVISGCRWFVRCRVVRPTARGAAYSRRNVAVELGTNGRSGPGPRHALFGIDALPSLAIK
jgi:hypothetical protein